MTTPPEVLALAREIANKVTATGQDTEHFCYEFLAAKNAAILAIQRTTELAAKHAEGREVERAGDTYMTCGNGHFWDAGTAYDQARGDVADSLRSLDHLKGQSNE